MKNGNKSMTIKEQMTEFLLYTAPSGEVKVEVFLHNESLWLTQKKIAELFDVNVPAISKHLNNIYEESELNKGATISILETVQNEGGRNVKRQMEFYNLDAIIAVGYRVNSKKATQFRIWATKILKDYIIKGFALNDEGLKNGRFFGVDYLENQIEQRNTLTMEQLAESVNKFLEFNNFEILDGKGKISHKQAEQKAFAEYGEFNKTQGIESDFDREVKKLLKYNLEK